MTYIYLTYRIASDYFCLHTEGKRPVLLCYLLPPLKTLFIGQTQFLITNFN